MPKYVSQKTVSKAVSEVGFIPNHVTRVTAGAVQLRPALFEPTTTLPFETAGFMKLPELLRLIGVGRTTIHNWSNPNGRYFDENFPKRVRLGGPRSRSVGWIRSEVHAWLCLQAANRAAGPNTHGGAK